MSSYPIQKSVKACVYPDLLLQCSVQQKLSQPVPLVLAKPYKI